MARPWRIQYEGAIYHVMSSGVGRGKIFLANDDYSRFLKYVASAKEKFNLYIFAFILNSSGFFCLDITYVIQYASRKKEIDCHDNPNG